MHTVFTVCAAILILRNTPELGVGIVYPLINARRTIDTLITGT